MKKRLPFIISITLLTSFASAHAEREQEPQVFEVPMNELCDGNQDPSMDRLCEWSQSMSGSPSIDLIPESNEPKPRWILRLSFGPFLSSYGKTDIRFDTPDVRLEAKGVKWAERNSMGYYDVFRKKENFGKIFQFIDEPTNVFHLELERASEFSIGLRIAHPKSVVSRVHHDEGRPIENLVRIDGTVDGVEHSGVENFYDSIYEIRLSRQFYEFQLTGDKIFLLNRRHARHGTLDYRVGAGVGLFAGYAVVVRQKQDTGEWVESSGDWKPVGFSASLNHRLVYTRPKGVLSLALGETFSTGRVRAEVMDGTLTVPNMKRHSVSLTLGVRLGKRLRRN